MIRGPVLLAALLLDAALGEPRALWQRVPHPAVLMGRAVGWADRRFNDGTVRSGLLVWLGLACVAWFIGVFIEHLPLSALWQALIAAALLAQRSLVEHVRAVADALEFSAEEARPVVARIVGRDTSTLDAPAIARAAIESAAESLSDGVVAPAFWFAVAGLPGLLVYKLTNTADSMIGYRTPRHEAFGKAAARIDDVLNWLPARLTALLIAALHRKLGQWREIARDARQHVSPNAGWPEAAMAQVLGVALAGPRSYHGVATPLAWVNEKGNRSPGPAEVRASLRVLWHVWLALVAGAAVWALLALA